MSATVKTVENVFPGTCTLKSTASFYEVQGSRAACMPFELGATQMSPYQPPAMVTRAETFRAWNLPGLKLVMFLDHFNSFGSAKK